MDATAASAEKVAEGRERILGELRKVIVGQDDVVDQVLIALFTGGHCLITGVPGLAKTLLIKTLADIAKNGTPGARVSAAIALLDRAYGKAPTFSTSDTQAFKRAVDMTDDELATIVSRAKLTLVKSDN